MHFGINRLRIYVSIELKTGEAHWVADEVIPNDRGHAAIKCQCWYPKRFRKEKSCVQDGPGHWKTLQHGREYKKCREQMLTPGVVIVYKGQRRLIDLMQLP